MAGLVRLSVFLVGAWLVIFFPQPLMAGEGGVGPAEHFVWKSKFFGPDFDGEVRATVMWDDGSGPKLYAAGNFLTADDAVVHQLARWEHGRWRRIASPLHDVIDGEITAMIVFNDELVAGGEFVLTGGVPNWRAGVFGAPPELIFRDGFEFGDEFAGLNSGASWAKGMFFSNKANEPGFQPASSSLTVFSARFE